MKRQLESGLSTSWNSLLNSFQEGQLEFSKGLKEKIKRQTKLVDSDLNEEEVEELCKDPQKANELLQQKMLGATSSLTMQNVISDIQDKYRDIQRLTESVDQIYHLFADLAILIQ